MTRSVYDPIRQILVAATPEERVRQKLLDLMIRHLGYPKGLIAVEKTVGQTGRRADIVCYSPNMSPLLLVECKAYDLSEQAKEQAFGYNAFLDAPFIALATAGETITHWFDGVNVASVPFLPRYADLLQQGRV